MNNITKVRFCQLRTSKYIKPFKLIYETNNCRKCFEMCVVHDSISVIIYNITRNVLVFVKQFRAGLYSGHIVRCEGKLRNLNSNEIEKYPGELGMAIELCAGIKDKNKSMVEIAREEVLEETGYNVPLEKFELVHIYNTSLDIAGSMIHTYYCEVTDKMKESDGGGIDEELIEVVEMSPENWIQFMKKPNLPTNGSFIVGYYWFFANKYKKKIIY